MEASVMKVARVSVRFPKSLACTPASSEPGEGALDHPAARQAGDVVAAKTHDEGLAMLDEGKISAYFGDRSILLFLIKQSKAPDKLRLGDDYLSVEPYALALPRGDSDFRLAVDRALSHIYRSGEIVSIFQRTFGGKAEPSQILRTLYVISGLPD